MIAPKPWRALQLAQSDLPSRRWCRSSHRHVCPLPSGGQWSCTISAALHHVWGQYGDMLLLRQMSLRRPSTPSLSRVYSISSSATSSGPKKRKKSSTIVEWPVRTSLHLVRLTAFDPTWVCASFATAGAECNCVTVHCLLRRAFAPFESVGSAVEASGGQKGRTPLIISMAS